MDFSLNEDQLRLRDVARRFANDEVRPAARLLDRESDPIRWNPVDLVRRASQLGLRLLSIPREHGGLGADTLTQVIVLEELCAGDAGFGMALMHAWREGWLLSQLGTDDQRQRYLAPLVADETFLTALAMTEPEAGSDFGLPYTAAVEAGPRTTATPDGDEWVINGHKTFITNASVARLVIVVARTDTRVPWVDGSSMIIVPAGTPGLRAGPPEHELGVRLRLGGELHFENCRVPSSNLLGPANSYHHLHLGRGNKTKEAAKALGVGRAAYEFALEYARHRVQGGTRIADHQLVAGDLADMATELEMARTLIWRAAWALDHDPEASAPLEDMAKVATTEIVMRVATRALQIWGHAGALSRNPIEKLVRDAAVMLLPPIGNSAARARLGAWLADQGPWLDSRDRGPRVVNPAG